MTFQRATLYKKSIQYVWYCNFLGWLGKTCQGSLGWVESVIVKNRLRNTALGRGSIRFYQFLKMIHFSNKIKIPWMWTNSLMKDFETVCFQVVQIAYCISNYEFSNGIIYTPVWVINMKCRWAGVLVCVVLVVYEM